MSDVEEILKELRREGPPLWKRARQGTQVGFPTSSEPGNIGSGGGDDRIAGIVAARVDAHPFVGDDDECDQCSGSRRHPDHHAMQDVVRDAWFSLYDHVQRARDEMVGAQRRLAKTMRPAEKPHVPAGASPCVSHERINVYVPAFRRGRCEWCWNWSRMHLTFEDVPIAELLTYEERRKKRVEGKSA